MSSKVEFIYLSQEDVRATGIDMAQVIGMVEKVLGLHDEGKVNLPLEGHPRSGGTGEGQDQRHAGPYRRGH